MTAPPCRRGVSDDYSLGDIASRPAARYKARKAETDLAQEYAASFPGHFFALLPFPFRGRRDNDPLQRTPCQKAR